MENKKMALDLINTYGTEVPKKRIQGLGGISYSMDSTSLVPRRHTQEERHEISIKDKERLKRIPAKIITGLLKTILITHRDLIEDDEFIEHFPKDTVESVFEPAKQYLDTILEEGYSLDVYFKGDTSLVDLFTLQYTK